MITDEPLQLLSEDVQQSQRGSQSVPETRPLPLWNNNPTTEEDIKISCAKRGRGPQRFVTRVGSVPEATVRTPSLRLIQTSRLRSRDSQMFFLFFWVFFFNFFLKNSSSPLGLFGGKRDVKKSNTRRTGNLKRFRISQHVWHAARDANMQACTFALACRSARHPQPACWNFSSLSGSRCMSGMSEVALRRPLRP